MIWQYVRFENSYDIFHENSPQLYRVGLKYERPNFTRKIASNFGATGHAMKSDFPEVKEYCRIVKTSLFTSDLGSYFANALEFSHLDAHNNLVAFNEENVWFADAPILSMFSFPLISGTTEALKEPNSVVITESIARKYFGTQPALGRELRLNREMVLKVTGVIQDIPVNSHLQFNILISFSTLRPRLGDMYDNWGWSVFYTYILIEKETGISSVESKLNEFKNKYIGTEDDAPFKTGFFFQPIREIHLKSGIEGEQSPTGSERTVYFLTLLAGFILLIAFINYINLSTAKSLERAREVGLRKTLGASKKQLISQFLFDTAVVNLFALVLSVVIVAVLWNSFEQLTGKRILPIVFSGDLITWTYAITFFSTAVLIAGVYPAITLSSFQPVKVLKGKFIKSSAGSMLRKMMVSFQYALAILLMAGTVLMYLQLSYMRSFDKGFTDEQVLVVDAPAVYDSTANEKIGFFRNQCLRLPGVVNVSATSDVPGRFVVEGSPIGPASSQSDADFFHSSIAAIDTNFFSTLEIPLIEGRIFGPEELMDFRRVHEDESVPAVINEEMMRRLGIKDPESVLDLKLTFWWGPDQRFARVIGVVASHHQLSLKERLEPIIYVQPRWDAAKYFAVRMQGNQRSLVNEIGNIYDQAFSDHPFTYTFLDEYFNAQYRDDDHFSRIFNVFTALAIFVTCLGLLGLSVYSVAQRTKEMGIRKVLGASSSRILLLFSREFLRVLAVSYLVAIPLIYWAGESWLSGFTFRIDVEWPVYILPLAILIVITMFTVTVVSIRAAVETPVTALRQE